MGEGVSWPVSTGKAVRGRVYHGMLSEDRLASSSMSKPAIQPRKVMLKTDHQPGIHDSGHDEQCLPRRDQTRQSIRKLYEQADSAKDRRDPLGGLGQIAA